ncbi:MAG TPA: signal peptide peptidase SppA [Candidatus Limnocylindrales bacterium]|nr:signal peptide peptidase SppA [Candidatus Limnocylindrales bacterium]
MNEPGTPRRPRLIFRLLRGLYRTGRFFFASIGLFVTVAPAMLLYIALSSDSVEEIAKAPKAGVNEDVLVEMQLGGRIAETAPDMRFQVFNRLLGARRHLYLPDLVKVLERASTDEKVQGLFIEIEDLRASPAAITELRQAFVRFRQAGKPLAFHLTEADTDAYYLATAGDTVEMTPAGSLEVPGPVFHLMYMGSALEKLGVEFQVVRAGKYKSAFEPLISDTPSPATLEMMQSMEESLRGHLADTIADSRRTTPEKVRDWMKRGLFTADEALEAGLVDRLSYSAEHEMRLRGKWEAKEKMKLSRYGSATRGREAQDLAGIDERIGVIEAEGEIVLYDDGGDDEGMITPRRLAKAFQWARKEDDIKAVVFRISSPGGSAIASDLIWKEVRRTTRVKPVVVSMGASAASGGYYVAAPASRILAEPTTITGSIGVLAGLPKLPGFPQKWGLSFHTVTQTDRIGLYSPSRTPSRQDAELLADQVDHTYDTFVRKVAQGRGLEMGKVYSLAEGRVYTGLEAYGLGLVDELGGFTEAVKAAVELAELDTSKRYRIKRYGYETDILDCLRSFSSLSDCLSEGETASHLHSRMELALASQVGSIARSFERERVLLRLPFILARGQH